MSQGLLVSIAKWVLGVAVGVTLVEGLVRTFLLKAHYDWRACGVSLMTYVGRVLIDALPFAAAMPWIHWFYEHRFLNLDISTWQGVLVLFLTIEFAYYWLHRWSHRVRWLWLTHAVHHAPSEFNFSVNFRVGWFTKFTLNMITFSPVALLGFTPASISFAVMVMLVGQFWIHNTWVPRFGPMEWIFNSPSLHRVHHAINEEYLDVNYGGLLIIFDRIFGTYKAENPQVQTKYGWVQPFQSYNPLVVVFRPWMDLWKDLRQAKGLKDYWKALFGAPL